MPTPRCAAATKDFRRLAAQQRSQKSINGQLYWRAHVNRPTCRVNCAARASGDFYPNLCQIAKRNVGRNAHNRARRRMDFPTRARLHTVREIGKERLIRWWCVDQAARLAATRFLVGVAPLLLQLSVEFTDWATWSCCITHNAVVARQDDADRKRFSENGLWRSEHRREVYSIGEKIVTNGSFSIAAQWPFVNENIASVIALDLILTPATPATPRRMRSRAGMRRWPALGSRLHIRFDDKTYRLVPRWNTALQGRPASRLDSGALTIRIDVARFPPCRRQAEFLYLTHPRRRRSPDHRFDHRFHVRFA